MPGLAFTKAGTLDDTSWIDPKMHVYCVQQGALDPDTRRQPTIWKNAWVESAAAYSFAWLWRDKGKRQKARDLLAPVYGWFTEGFDTLDLKEAKALLEELA